jgi:glycosyltransferase involved in cell wall biosynthesis
MMPVPRSTASKVLFVNRYFYPDQSATSQLLTDLSRALSEARFEVHVICSRQCYDDPSAHLPSKESIGSIEVHRIWTSRFGRDRLLGRALDYATFYCTSWFAMLRLLQKGDTVIAETDPPLMSIVAMLAAKLKGARLINWLQDIFPEVATSLGANPLPPPLDALLRRWRNASLRFARINIVLGERMCDQLRNLGIPAQRIQIIENWAERDRAIPTPVRGSALRLRLGLGDKFVVGYSGNLGRAHEFMTLLRAAESLRTQADMVFLMIGGGSGMAQLAEAVQARDLRNFLFLPYQPRDALADALAAADVHWVSLLPALEGFIVPSKFYGILAAARPVIFIGDLDGELAREIKSSGCGATVAVADVAELTRLLGAWKSDSIARDDMGQLGYRRYREHYCAQRAFEQWIEILTPPSHVAGALSLSPSRQ